MAEMSQAPASSQANSSETRPIYEVGYQVAPSSDEAAATKVTEAIRAQLEKNDAEIINEGAPTRMRLAYTVERVTTGKHEKFDEAYFGFIKFAVDREHVVLLQEMLHNNHEILRSLIVETVREDLINAPRRVTFTSDRLEGETIKKPTSVPEKAGEVSEEDLDKSIDALVS